MSCYVLRSKLTLKPSTTFADELTVTQPLPSSDSVCADKLPDPDSTTSNLPWSSKAMPRGRAKFVATTCHLYPEAMEGLTLPDGDGPHDDCADTMAANRNAVAR